MLFMRGAFRSSFWRAAAQRRNQTTKIDTGIGQVLARIGKATDRDPALAVLAW
jgi:hypothetical protein